MIPSSSHGSMPSPGILLGTRHTHWRGGQVEAINLIREFYINNLGASEHGKVPKLPLSMPTGSGKSLVYMGASANLLDEGLVNRVIILTSTKALQDQLEIEFKHSLLKPVFIKGKNSYQCDIIRNLTAATAPCNAGYQCGAKESGDCTYYGLLDAARRARVVVTNYAYWMRMVAAGPERGLGHFDLAFKDEAHHAPEVALDFCTIDLKRDDIEDFAEIPTSWGANPELRDVQTWAAVVQIEIEPHLQRYRADLKNRHSSHAAHKFNKLTTLNNALGQIREKGEAYKAFVHEGTLRVARVNTSQGWTEPIMFAGLSASVLLSATVSSGTMALLGDKDARVVSVESSLPKERRPVSCFPAIWMNRKTTDLQLMSHWVKTIDDIIAERLDRKGIIHTQSFSRAQFLHQHSRFRDKFFIPKSGMTSQTVEAFKRAKAPSLLVAPNVTTGYDFPGDECRYQIIGKTPYPSLGDPVVDARRKSIPNYFNNCVAQALSQASGRGMRGAEDWCETIIIDACGGEFINKNRGLFPPWFMDGYKGNVTFIPSPMRP